MYSKYFHQKPNIHILEKNSQNGYVVKSRKWSLLGQFWSKSPEIKSIFHVSKSS